MSMRSDETAFARSGIRFPKAVRRNEVRVVSHALRQLYPIPSDRAFDGLLGKLDRVSRSTGW